MSRSLALNEYTVIVDRVRVAVDALSAVHDRSSLSLVTLHLLWPLINRQQLVTSQ